MPVVDTDKIKEACSALKALEQQRKDASEKLDLLDDDEKVLLVFNLRNISRAQVKPKLISLPNGIYGIGERPEVCLIVKDPGADVARQLAQRKVTGITQVMGLTKLRNEYKSFESKRQLLASYDLFLADDRVIDYLPRLLGSTFYKRNRQPIPVSLRRPAKWQAMIDKVTKGTSFILSGGSCCVVCAGRTGYSLKELSDNVQSCVTGFVSHLPHGLRSITAIYLKTNESLSLPIYVAPNTTAQQALTSATDAAAAAPDAAPSTGKKTEKKNKKKDDDTKEKDLKKKNADKKKKKNTDGEKKKKDDVSVSKKSTTSLKRKVKSSDEKPGKKKRSSVKKN